MTRKEINALRRDVERAESWLRMQRLVFKGAITRLRRAKAAFTAAKQH